MLFYSFPPSCRSVEQSVQISRSASTVVSLSDIVSSCMVVQKYVHIVLVLFACIVSFNQKVFLKDIRFDECYFGYTQDMYSEVNLYKLYRKMKVWFSRIGYISIKRLFPRAKNHFYREYNEKVAKRKMLIV